MSSYLTVAIGSIVLVDVEPTAALIAFLAVAAASIALGWYARSPLITLLALSLVLFSLPFGRAEETVGTEAPLIPLYGAEAALVSALLIAASWALHRHRQQPTKASGSRGDARRQRFDVV